jgi:hypothetical protein
MAWKVSYNDPKDPVTNWAKKFDTYSLAISAIVTDINDDINDQARVDGWDDDVTDYYVTSDRVAIDLANDGVVVHDDGRYIVSRVK